MFMLTLKLILFLNSKTAFFFLNLPVLGFQSHNFSVVSDISLAPLHINKLRDRSKSVFLENWRLPTVTLPKLDILSVRLMIQGATF